MLLRLLLFTVIASRLSGLELSDEWKFKAGDKMAWAAPDFDDAQWKVLKAGQTWFEQGHKGYKGFAWYRQALEIPAAWAQDPYFVKEQSLRLDLGRIMDADECYVNGEKVGATGRIAPSVRSNSDPRSYRIPARLIRFGQPNVIAVRVLGSHLGGGMFAGPYTLRPSNAYDHLGFTPGLGRGDGSFPAGKPMQLSATFEGSVPAQVTCSVETDDGRPMATFSGPFKRRLSFSWQPPAPGVYRVTWSAGEFSHAMNLVYAPEAMARPSTRQPDFQEFWDRTRKELAGVDPKFKMSKQDFPDIKTLDIYLVEFRSLGGAKVRGWYSRPKKEGRYPAILETPGAGGEMHPQLWDGLDDFCVFSLNPRGHGNSKAGFKADKAGFWLTGLESPETFAFRGAYMDCLRAVDFLMTRPEVDPSRIVAEGISQGGGFSLAAASLDPRIALCVADVPGMADWESYETVRKEGNSGWKDWLEAHPKATREGMQRALSYCDNVNLTPWMKAEAWVISGLQDPRVPPRGVFEAYAAIPGRKKLKIYPFGTHDAGGGRQWFSKYEEIREHFRMPAHPGFQKVKEQKFKASAN